jgi:hypothetical protein
MGSESDGGAEGLEDHQAERQKVNKVIRARNSRGRAAVRFNAQRNSKLMSYET